MGNRSSAEKESAALLLIGAAAAGDLRCVRKLVRRGAAVKGGGPHGGNSPLLEAAKHGHFAVVKFLVDHGGDVEEADAEGRTALMLAAERGDENTVQSLMDLGANRRATDSTRKTPLNLAVEYGHLNIVRRLIYSATDTNARDSMGKTPLIHAIESNRLGIVRHLVDRGADVNVADDAGRTPLIHAVMENNAFAVECLVERGANVNAADNEGGTPLTYAVAKDNMSVFRYLVNSGANLETDQGHAQVVEYLLNIVSQSPTRPEGLAAAADDRDAPSYEWKASVGEVPMDVEPEWLQRREELLVNRWTCLGAGGFGQVYRAKWLNSNVVVKEVITGGDAVAQNSYFYSTSAVSREHNQLAAMDASDAEKFRREANIWYRLNHPHIVQLFGACYGDSSGSLPLFVCEYATNGSLNNYLAANPDQIWHKLYEVALAVQYLHQRGIVHGDLKCNNIVVGSDLKAKVTDFGLSSVLHQREEDSAQITGAVQWVAPECLGDDRVHATLESDIYSLGMCIIEALRITEIALSDKPELPPYPWGDLDALIVKFRVKTLKELPSKPPSCTSEQWELVSQMCANDPRQRLQIATVAYFLEGFSKTLDVERCLLVADTPVRTVWRSIGLRMYGASDLQLRLYHELQDMLAWFERAPRPRRLVTRFHELVKHFLLAIDHGFRHHRILSLSSRQPSPSSIGELVRCLHDLWRVIEHVTDDGLQAVDRCALPQVHIDLLISADPPVWLVTNDLLSWNDRRSFLDYLGSEVGNYNQFSSQECEVIQLALDAIARQADVEAVVSKPRWFIPWYEVKIDESSRLGKGGFGTVYRAKWLDSDVVVKRMNSWGAWELERSPDVSLASSCSSSSARSNSFSEAKKRNNDTPLKLFRREADIWFSLNHPHVVRLYGACHIGDPFFACEYASNGSLSDYLRAHPDQIWYKLYEAALGVGYIHARGVVHGDLKCNNVVVGGDGKAKVTDFGLSALLDEDTDEDESIRISDAWQWVAPECLDGARPTRESDIYSLGMCIIEALRVVEASRLKLTEAEFPRYPWGARPNSAVKFMVTRLGRLPNTLPSCTERHWELVTSMCKSNPGDRITIDAVVSQLGAFR